MMAGPGGSADRAVIFNKEEATASERLRLGHVALIAAQCRKAADPLGQAPAGGQGRPIALGHGPLPLGYQAIEALLAEYLTGRPDDLERQGGMGVGKPPVGPRRQTPEALRPANRARDILKGHKILIQQGLKVLSGARKGDRES